MGLSVFQQAIHHAYAQTDGTYAWPNSREGDMLREAKKEIENSITVQTEDELRVLVELLCHSKGAPGFDQRISRLRDEAVASGKRGSKDSSNNRVTRRKACRCGRNC